MASVIKTVSLAVPVEVSMLNFKKLMPSLTLFRYDYCPDGSVISTSGGNVMRITLFAGTGFRNFMRMKNSVSVDTWF